MKFLIPISVSGFFLKRQRVIPLKKGSKWQRKQFREFGFSAVFRRPHICLAGRTAGLVTQLLEVLTGKSVKVETISQGVIKATRDIARLLDIGTGEDVNDRLVTLKVDDIVYVLAKSLSPINRIPEAVRADLMRADIPIGRILREHKLETRREYT